MELFFELSIKLVPIYILVLLGFVAGRYLNIGKESVANLLIFILAPIVVFNGILNTEMNVGTLSLPLLFLAISCVVAMTSYFLAGFVWSDSNRNILAFLAGSSNSGFFGIPMVVAIFGTSAIGVAALAVIGTTLYLNTLGYFIAAKGKHSTKESLKKLLQMPIIYASIAGLIANFANLQINEQYSNLINNFNGAFIVLGMMLVGLGLADIKKIRFDLKFIAFSTFSKFILWPLAVLIILVLDDIFFGIYDEQTRKIIFMISIVPIAANVVAYSTILKSHPEKTALSVFITTITALLIVPIVAAIIL